MLGEKLVIFALDPKLDWVIVTLVLTSAPKFLWLEVHFDKLFWFWYETEIVPEKSYYGIWPFLEIHTLNGNSILPKRKDNYKWYNLKLLCLTYQIDILWRTAIDYWLNDGEYLINMYNFYHTQSFERQSFIMKLPI